MPNLGEILELDTPAGTDRMMSILEEAAEMFAELGYTRTSMRNIAEKCGLSKAALYHYFPSKDAILKAIALGASKALVKHVISLDQPDALPTERLRIFMVASAEFFERFRFAHMLGSTLFWSDPSVDTRRELVMSRDRYETHLREIIEDGVGKGAFAGVDVALAGRLVLSSLNWMPRWYKPTGTLTATQIAQSYADMIISGLTGQQGR